MASSNLKFIWHGWHDAYDSLYVPKLVDEKGAVVWWGGHYYSDEWKEKLETLRAELIAACTKFGLPHQKFLEDVSNWDIEDQRHPS